MTDAAAPPGDIAHSLRAIAGSLESIADSVRGDAAAATATMRELEDTSSETAALATALATAAQQIEHAVATQAALLAKGSESAGTSLTLVEDLRHMAAGIGMMSSTIGEIAGRSRLLALNARIEAARAGAAGRGFDVVANEMGVLAKSTLAANHDIEGRTSAIDAGVGAVLHAVEGVGSVFDSETRLIGDIVTAVQQQKDIAADVARLTEATHEQVRTSAAAIGRVSTSAGAVSLLARSIKQAAGKIGE